MAFQDIPRLLALVACIGALGGMGLFAAEFYGCGYKGCLVEAIK